MSEDTKTLNDNELDEVNGGKTKFYDKATGKYYRWNGHYAYDKQYLCPKCGKPLSTTFGFRYDCSSCDDYWIRESSLVPNLASGLWKEISKDEYDNGSEGQGLR